MIDIAVLRAMASAGATVEMILAAVEAAQAKEAEKVSERRAKEAERQKRYRLSRVVTRTNAESRVVTGCPRDGRDIDLSLSSDKETPKEPSNAHIDNNLLTQSKKKESKKVYLCADIPERPPEEAITFSKGEGGWLLERTLREWQRFRDYQISKNKKHNSFVAVMASWRNWVRSPFQSQGSQNGQSNERSALKASERILEKFGGLEAAASYVPGSSGPKPLSLDYDDEPPSPRLISSR